MWLEHQATVPANFDDFTRAGVVDAELATEPDDSIDRCPIRTDQKLSEGPAIGLDEDPMHPGRRNGRAGSPCEVPVRRVSSDPKHLARVQLGQIELERSIGARVGLDGATVSHC